LFEVPPLAILAVGVCTVLGLIIVLRLNAFLALIAAAIVVSVLAPGPVADKVGRVAAAFGSTAGKIGVVIAAAAVVGKCMMDSGAADRIVRAFMRLLGQRRAPTALMGSGFVLSIPVFFDTVFYLLVPLARSLYRRTGRQYVKYLLAIAAGGAVTHTLVPPTPGPLGMASNLNVDVGMMILIGALVAAPAAVVGLMFAGWADRRRPIPMRPIGSEPDPEPLPDEQLPPLWLALLPVVLPVLMISTNTVLATLADAQRPALLAEEDITHYNALVADLRRGAAQGDPSPAGRVMEMLPGELRQALAKADASAPLPAELRGQLLAALNHSVIDNKEFYQPAMLHFSGVLLDNARIDYLLQQHGAAPGAGASAAGQASQVAWDEPDRLRRLKVLNAMRQRDRNQMKRGELQRLNRLLLEVAFPASIAPHRWETPLRRAADRTALLGDANLALLVSAAVALVMLARQRKTSLNQLAQVVEVSLMSAGVIILITSAGGAFGAMLGEAQVGDAIKTLFGREVSGIAFLGLGFGVAALLKVAQGSSTVAMITGSAMLAGMLTSPGQLPFHPVYLATAIGGGSLIGSWMNDSGFWIFAKMGGLTEVETLRTWTVLLVVLGATAMAVTLLLVHVLPLA
jgi:GntP family gluconate:H+ symporter